MRNPTLFWGAVLGTLGVCDWALNTRHDGSTLSEVTRLVFRTDTAWGRTAFTLALMGGGSWFHQHIVRGECPWAPCSTN